jgi:hypothetical protein
MRLRTTSGNGIPPDRVARAASATISVFIDGSPLCEWAMHVRWGPRVALTSHRLSTHTRRSCVRMLKKSGQLPPPRPVIPPSGLQISLPSLSYRSLGTSQQAGGT